MKQLGILQRATCMLGVSLLPAGSVAAAEPEHVHHHANMAPVNVGRDPTDLPPALPRRPAQEVNVELEASEVTGFLATGASYHYWTFGGKVPGPFLRVRVGDTVNVTLKNNGENQETHSVDFHAAQAPHGGGMATAAETGGSGTFSFKAMRAGLFVYHCATPVAAEHIANGMAGLILVEPEQALPPVDHEYYFLQGEIYTEQPYGSEGLLAYSRTKLLAEQPEYYVLNGLTGKLADKAPLRIKAGETVRIFFGNGGPNRSSALHVIGGIFDEVYQAGSLENAPLKAVQTINVPPGSATIATLRFAVPGKYVLVDHALARVERGLFRTFVVAE